MDGNLKLILGLLQLLMNRFAEVGATMDSTHEQQHYSEIHQTALLVWLQALLSDLAITNLSTDWSDGRALSTLINTIQPELIPHHASLDPSEGQTNIQEAMRVAKKSLNIKQVIEPSKLSLENPDPIKVVAYLSQFCSPRSCGYQFMLDWINPLIPRHHITNFTSNWEDGRALCAFTEVFVPSAGLDRATLEAFRPLDWAKFAIECAERELEVQPLLTAQDFVSRKTKELLRMAYLMQFMNAKHRSPELSPADSPLPSSKVAPEIHPDTTVHSKPFESDVDLTDIDDLFGKPQQRFELKTQEEEKDTNKEISQREEIELERERRRQKEPERERKKKDLPSIEIPIPEALRTREERNSELDDIFSAVEDEIDFDQVLKDLDGFSNPTTPRTPNGKNAALPTPTSIVAPVMAGSHERDHSLDLDFEFDSDVISSSDVGSSRSPEPVVQEVLETAEVIREEGVESGVDPVQTSTSPKPSSDHSNLHSSKRKRKHRDSLKTHPELCKAVGMGLYNGAVGKPSQFTVNCSKGGQGRLDITVLSPSGNNIEASGKPMGDGVFELFFVPDTVGNHKILIQFNEEDIPDSPFECQVCDPSACIALGDGLYKCTVGMDTEFEIICQNAGPVSISTSFSGPAKPISYKLITSNGGSYTYRYHLGEPGEYFIDVKCQGYPIPGSPFKVVAEHAAEEEEEGVPNVSLCFIQDYPMKHIQVGEEISFIVDCTQAGHGSLSAFAAGRFGESHCKVSEPSKGLYRVIFCPQVVDSYNMHLIFSDQELTCSPLNFVVSNPRNIVLHVNDIIDKAHGIGQSISFLVDMEHCGEGELTARATCTSGESDVDMILDGNKATIKYTFKVAGLHSIYLFFNGLAIESSPVELTAVMDESDSIDDMVLTKSIPVSGGYRLLNKTLEFQVYSSRRDFSDLKVSAVGMRTGIEPYTNVIPTPDGICNIEFKATEPDDYRVSVLYKSKHLSGSPFTIPIRMMSRPNKVAMCDPVIPLNGRNPLELVFDTSNAGDGVLLASVVNSNQMSIPVNVVQSSDGIYRVVFEPVINDTFYVSIKFAGKHITGSPFKVMYEEQRKTPPVVIDFEPEMDERGLMGAAIFGRNTGRQDAQVQQYERGKYQVTFQPEKPDIFDVHCYWFEKELPGSPFEINLLGPENGVVDTVPIVVGDKVGLLSASVVGQRNGSTPIKLTPIEDCLCNIKFSAPARDTFDLSVYWNGKILSGTPIHLHIH